MIKMLLNYVPFILVPFMGWGVMRMLKKKNQFTPLKKVTLYIGLTAFFLTEIARSFYRPYIYQNQIFDYYISDTIGNSLGTVAAIFMILTLSGRGNKQDWRIIVLIIIGLIAYELLNLTSDYAFDYRDVIATFIFGGFSCSLYFYLLEKHIKNK